MENKSLNHSGAAKVAFVVIFFGSVLLFGDKEVPVKTAKATKATKAVQKVCNTLQCRGQDNLTRASTRCRKAIQKRAKYQHQWTVGSYDHIFTHWKRYNKSTDIILYIGDKIKMQNGFGAYVNQVYSCAYSISNKKALFIDIGAGRL